MLKSTILTKRALKKIAKGNLVQLVVEFFFGQKGEDEEERKEGGRERGVPLLLDLRKYLSITPSMATLF